MKHYFLFDAIVQTEKTAAMVSAANALIAFLNVDVLPLKKAKADMGNELMGHDKLKFFERNAYNLSLAAHEERDILCFEQSSLISLRQTKEALLADENLKHEIEQRLAKEKMSLNLDTNVISLEQFLIEKIGLEKLRSLITHPYERFQAALFLGTSACRAKKYTNPELLTTLLDLVKLKCVKHASTFESDGFEVYDASSLLAKKLASKAMLDMFDNAADFVLVNDARSFIMFDFHQKELEKLAGREIGLSVLTLPELLLLAFGVTDKKSIGLNRHKVAVTLI